MDKLFKWGMIVFLICTVCLGNEQRVMNSIMNIPKEVYNLVSTLVLSACLWGGFLNLIEKSEFMNLFSFVLKPILKLIYGSIISDYKLYNYLSSNVMANLLGMGTLSTISGLKAFGYIYDMKKKVSREMLTLVIVNTAGLSLFPSSLIMLRKDMGSTNLYEFYPYMIFISIVVLVIGLVVQRIIDHE